MFPFSSLNSSIDETSKQKEKEDEQSTEVVEKPKGRRGRKPAAKSVVDEPKKIVPETKSTIAIESESVEVSSDDKKVKRGARRAKTQPATSDDKESANEVQEVPKINAGRRTRKNSQSQAQVQIVDLTVDTPLKTISEAIEPQAEKKTRRGRPKKVVVEESEPTAKPGPSEAPKTSMTKRTASKSEETTTSVKEVASKVEEPAKPADVPVVEPVTTRGKRSRKATNEPEAEVEVSQPPQKRTRNTKKTTEMESKEEISAKEGATEKPTRKTKKAAESKDTDDANSTPPISKRTRRHK